jgi:cell division protein FtsI (penicillin-binding protein 3)
VVLDARERVAVPRFIGDSVRKAIEQAGSAGLSVQVLGNGVAAQQAPAAGTMVPVGTEIVVRFARDSLSMRAQASEQPGETRQAVSL